MSTSSFVVAPAWNSRDLRRAAVALAVVAAHAVLIFVLEPGRRRSTDVVEVTLLPLPITPDERPRPELLPAQVSVRRRSVDRMRRDIPTAVRPSAPESMGPNDATGSIIEEPAAPIDWNAQIQVGADSVQKRADTAREQYSFSTPRAPSSMTPKHVKPPCPFIECEPTWGSGFSVFESQASKAGRVEKSSMGETIRWISDRCYQILVTNNIMHRAMIKCERPLKKDQPRSDLFEHMHDVPLPEEKATDVP